MVIKVLVFFLILISSTFAAPKEISPLKKSCYDKNNISKNDVLSEIEIEVDNYRSFIKNILNSMKYEFIQKKFKKKYKSVSKFKFHNGKICKVNTKIRLHGDLFDHIEVGGFLSGKFFASFHLDLKDENIYNNIQYKLFLPRTREHDEEIIGAYLFKSFGFMAPDTQYINLNFHGEKKKYLLQEHLNKEFLEKNNKIEGIIFEGNENFSLEKKEREELLSRVQNIKFVKRNLNSYLLNTIAVMNLLYIKDSSYKKKNNFKNDIFYIDYEFVEKIFGFSSRKRLREFNTLSLALNSIHGLSRNEMRLYHDKINNEIHPIFYDQGIKFFSNPDHRHNLTFAIKQNYITKDNVTAAKSLKEKLNKINQNDLYFKLLDKNIDTNQKQITYYLEKIKANLDFIINQEVSTLNFNDLRINNDTFKKFKLIFAGNNKNEFYLCKKIDNCELLNIEKVSKFVNSNFPYLFIGLESKDFLKLNISKKNNVYKNWQSIKLKNFEIFHNKNVEYFIDKQNKYIDFTFKDNGRVVFNGDSIYDWKIKGFAEKNGKLKFNNSLVGCITFADIKIKNLHLEFKNSYCEDAVNFINVIGKNIELNIQNSISDGVDADFSEIEFNNLNIKNSKNDCLDLSHGNYSVSESSFEYCGDKGISSGEKSITKLKNVLISNSNIAIASKDESKLYLNNLKSFSNNICLAAYRKKTEFSSGKIHINNEFLKKNNNCKNNLLN